MGYFSELLSDIVARLKLESGEDLPFKLKNISEDISSETYEIRDNCAAKKYGKPIGKYEIYTIPSVLDVLKSDRDRIITALVNSVSSMLGKVSKSSRVLVVGLGNRHISSDSLGAKVCHKINVVMDLKNFPTVMAICPSVLGLTGIETYDIVRGVCESVKPTHMILIDSLCASATIRLGRSIQLSNTGLCPGSGIGNNRRCIDSSLCRNIISIGVPLLIYASTFIKDSFYKNNIDISLVRNIMQTAENLSNNEDFLNFINGIEKIYNDSLDGIVVTSKDIENIVEILSSMISEAINKSLGVVELFDR